jgi:hypothetical protein
MQLILIFGKKFDCILFLQKIFGPGQKGVKWKYLEIKKTQKKPNCNNRNIFITIIHIFLFIFIM